MFFILSCGLYKKEHILRNCNSIDAQTNADYWHVLMIDNSRDYIPDISSSKRNAIYYNGINGSSKNTCYALNKFTVRTDDVVCMVDLDDELYPNALDVLKEYYSDPKVLLTYGSYENISGKPARFNGEYKEGEDIRLTKWRCSHLKTFRVSLWMAFVRQFKCKRMCDRSGAWLKAGADMAMMMNMYEIVGWDHTRHVPEVIYRYNDLNPLSDHRVRGDKQKEMEQYIRNMKPAKKTRMIY